uniref:Titin n=1 Tax=Sinocyclocheilus rhinocerous TaxID=307959 RepID=A0A673JAD8_9TELE
MESIKGSFAQLECLVSGSLPITVTWFKENKEIETDEKHKCIFFESAASLEITIIEKPESQDVIPGSRVQFNVLVSGTPPLTIKWFKDKKEVSSGIDCSVQKNDTSSLLELFFAKPSDSGDYVCEISNDVGSDACQATLLVKVTVVKPGQLVVFECQITGTPEIDTYWFRDGNEISPSDKHKMTFVDSLARCSMELRVKVLVKPLSPLEVVNGSNAYFECQVKGTAPFEVTWQKDSKDIKSSLKHVILQKNGSIMTLDVQKCDALDVGEYQCIVANERIENVVTVLGKKVEFKCVVRGSPPLSIQWQKDENWILEDPSIERTFLNSIATLRIPVCESIHSGRYTCQAVNEAGQEKCFATLVVQGYFDLPLKPVTVTEGETLTLSCHVRGTPPLKIQWMKDRQELSSSENTKITFVDGTATLEMIRVSKADTGDYLCKATNEAGSEFLLDVPAAPIGPVNILEVTPDSMVIEWRPPKDDGGSPVMNYIVEKRESNKETWGGVSSGSTSTTLKISRLQQGVEYVLRIRAENKMGIGAALESAPTVARHQFEPPGHPGKPVASDISEDALTLGWTMPLFDGGSPISGYIIERRHKGGKWIRVNKTPCKDLRYRVLGLFEDNEYEFRVFAENVAGFSGPSPISDPAKPCRPITVPGPPVNPKVKDYSCTYADLVWIRPTRDGGSPVLGYIVEYQKAGADLCIFFFLFFLIDAFICFKLNWLCMCHLEPPGPPGSLKVVDSTKTSVTLSWAKPVYDGGAPIIGYLVEMRDKVQMEGEQEREPEEGWKKCNTAGQLVITEFTMINLDERQEYEFRVSAQNQVGMGRPANLKDAVSPKEIHGKHLF